MGNGEANSTFTSLSDSTLPVVLRGGFIYKKTAFKMI